MASPKRAVAATSERAAANLRRLRKRRGLSTYDLADRLKDLGWPIQQSGLTRIERGERRVDADDLVALAAALECSPNLLLMPAETEAPGDGEAPRSVPVFGGSGPVADARDLWAWAVGERPLVLRDPAHPAEPLSEPTGQEVAMFQVENQPHHFGKDQAASWGMFAQYDTLRQLIREALASGMSPDQVIEVFIRMTQLTATEGEPSGDGAGS
jgi:transcriptional regulator with XRE-family HTH domain